MSSNEDYLDSLLNSVKKDAKLNDTEKAEIHSDEPYLMEGMDTDTFLTDGMDLDSSFMDHMDPSDSFVNEMNDTVPVGENSDADLNSVDDMLALLENADSEQTAVEDNSETGNMDGMDDLFDIFANEQEEQISQSRNSESPVLSDETEVMHEAQADHTDDQQINSELDELLGPVESKREEKARKKREKQEAKEKAKAEKEKAKQEKARLKAEKAKAGKTVKNHEESPQADADTGNHAEMKSESEVPGDIGFDPEMGMPDEFGLGSQSGMPDEFGLGSGAETPDEFGPGSEAEIPSDFGMGSETGSSDNFGLGSGIFDDLGFGTSLPEDNESATGFENEFDALLQEKEDKSKKKGLISRIISSLFEEVPEEEAETDEIAISDENRSILEEIGKEEIGNKKKQKKGKNKGKNKNKKVEETAEGDQEDSENTKKKNKKAKTAKKEKKPKEKSGEKKETDKTAGKKLPKKQVILIFAICLTLMGIVIICSMILPSYWDRKNARKAYYQGDYETVYMLLENENLNESDQMLYERSVMILILENKLDAYNLNMSLAQEKEAVNELFSAVAFYQKNLEYAQGIGALEEMQGTYEEILSLLETNLGISENRAVEIALMDSLDYNRELYYLLNGSEFTIPEMEQLQPAREQEVNSSDSREDMLPEEEEIPQPEDTVSPEISVDQGENADFGENINGDGNTDEYPDFTNEDGNSDAFMNDGGQENTDNIEEENALGETNEELLYSGTVENGSVVVQ